MRTSNFTTPQAKTQHFKSVVMTNASGERTYKGFNFFDEADQEILTIIATVWETVLNFFIPSEGSGKVEINSISRILKRLRLHGLIKKVSHTYKY